MTRHETMPEVIYQRQLQISANRDNLSSTDSSEVKELDKERKDEPPESDPENDDEDLEYDSSTDEDEELAGGNSRSEFDRRSIFLVGAITRFGRKVRINHRHLM